jgi:hypothetical protein
VALNYAVLIAGIAETLAGVLGLIKGIAYPAYVTSIFWDLADRFLSARHRQAQRTRRSRQTRSPGTFWS